MHLPLCALTPSASLAVRADLTAATQERDRLLHEGADTALRLDEAKRALRHQVETEEATAQARELQMQSLQRRIEQFVMCSWTTG